MVTMLILDFTLRYTVINDLTVPFSTCRATVSFDLEAGGDVIDGHPIQAKLLVTVVHGHCEFHGICIGVIMPTNFQIDFLFIGRAGGATFAKFDITNGVPLDIDLVCLLVAMTVSIQHSQLA